MILQQVNKSLWRKNLARQLFRFKHDEQTKVLYPLDNRRLIKVSGHDAADYLQGLITNDINHFQDGAQSIYAMFLNNKGRVLYDTLIHKWGDNNVFMIECDTSVLSLLQKHLKTYKLKRRVEIGDISPLFKIWALIAPPNAEIETGVDILRNVNIYKDPRLPELGYRLLTTTNVDQFDIRDAIGRDTVLENSGNGYKYLRHKLGVCEGAEDLFPGSSLPLEANCDYLHGVSFHKGCYIGQELTARVHHTGVVRKRVMPLKFKETNFVEDLEKETPILASSEVKANVGKLKSYAYDYGLGLVRIKEALEAKTLNVGPHAVEVQKPSWWPVEAPKEKLTLVKPETA